MCARTEKRPSGSNRLFAQRVWLGGTGALLVVALAGALAAANPNEDIAWLLYLAEQFCAGKRLYLDLVDVNPPLIVLLSAGPVWAARWLSIPTWWAFFAAVALALVLCCWAAARLLRAHAPLSGNASVAAAVLAAALAIAAGHEFGQREHLIVILALPYLALLARRMLGIGIASGKAAAIGGIAGIAFAIKPFYFVAFGLMEALAQWRGARALRPENVAVGLVALGYVAVIVVFFPAYITDALPLIFAYYGAPGTSPWRMLVAGRYVLAMGGAALVLGALDRRCRHDPLFLALMAFGTGGTVAYLLAWKGWIYHTLPAYAAFMLAALYAGSNIVARERGPRVLIVTLVAGVIAVALIPFARQVASTRAAPEAAHSQLAAYIRQHHVRNVLVLSRALSPAFPAVNLSGVTWTSRFDTMWALYGEALRAPDARPVRDAVVADFITAVPQLVVLDERASEGSAALRVLQSDAVFACAWRAYREVARFARLILYLRYALPCGAVDH